MVVRSRQPRNLLPYVVRFRRKSRAARSRSLFTVPNRRKVQLFDSFKHEVFDRLTYLAVIRRRSTSPDLMIQFTEWIALKALSVRGGMPIPVNCEARPGGGEYVGCSVR
ncbi:unnamed protein product [Calypogeia fissa]